MYDERFSLLQVDGKGDAPDQQAGKMLLFGYCQLRILVRVSHDGLEHAVGIGEQKKRQHRQQQQVQNFDNGVGGEDVQGHPVCEHGAVVEIKTQPHQRGHQENGKDLEYLGGIEKTRDAGPIV